MEGEPQPIQSGPVRVGVPMSSIPLKVFVVIFCVWGALTLITAGLLIYLDVMLITADIQRTTQTEPTPTGNSSAQPEKPQAAGLGSELYAQSENPVDGKIPTSPTPSSNPLKDTYKNPFN